MQYTMTFSPTTKLLQAARPALPLNHPHMCWTLGTKKQPDTIHPTTCQTLALQSCQRPAWTTCTRCQGEQSCTNHDGTRQPQTAVNLHPAPGPCTCPQQSSSTLKQQPLDTPSLCIKLPLNPTPAIAATCNATQHSTEQYLLLLVLLLLVCPYDSSACCASAAAAACLAISACRSASSAATWLLKMLLV